MGLLGLYNMHFWVFWRLVGLDIGGCFRDLGIGFAVLGVAGLIASDWWVLSVGLVFYGLWV